VKKIEEANACPPSHVVDLIHTVDRYIVYIYIYI